MRSFLVLEKSKSHIKNDLSGICCSQQTANCLHVDLGLRGTLERRETWGGGLGRRGTWGKGGLGEEGGMERRRDLGRRVTWGGSGAWGELVFVKVT